MKKRHKRSSRSKARKSQKSSGVDGSVLEAEEPFFASAPQKIKEEAPQPTLFYGSQGSMVSDLQQRLNRFGASLKQDGIFGPMTYAAVRNFQAKYAPPVDGIVGPITWKALNQSPDKVEDDHSVLARDYQIMGDNLLNAKQAIMDKDPVAHALFGGIVGQVAGQLISKGQTMNVSSGHAKKTDKAFDDLLNMLLKAVAASVDVLGLPAEEAKKSLRHKKAFALQQVFLKSNTKNLSKLTQEDAALFKERLRLMRDFYTSFLPNTDYSGGNPAMDKQDDIPGPNAAARERLVATALSDVGRVRARENPRYGGDYLKLIFDVAHEGNHPFPPIAFKKYWTQKSCAHGDTKCTETGGKETTKKKVDRDVLGSWCGVGALYWLKISAQPDLVWKRGKSSLSKELKHRPYTEKPVVGDVVIDKVRDHHGIITWIDPNAPVPKGETSWGAISIKTVEANVDQGQIVHAPKGHGKLNYFRNGAFNPFERA